MNFAFLFLLAAPSGQACDFDPVNGTLAYSAVPHADFDAAGRKWFINNESIAYAGGSYTKYGLPRQLAPFEIEAVGETDNIPIFIEAGNYVDEPEVIYLLVKSADCSFQPYQRG